MMWSQVVFYDMRRLHSIVVNDEAEERLSPDPTLGRLTLNMFWWQTPFGQSTRSGQSQRTVCSNRLCKVVRNVSRPCSAYTKCEGCSGTHLCTWCTKVSCLRWYFSSGQSIILNANTTDRGVRREQRGSMSRRRSSCWVPRFVSGKRQLYKSLG